LKLPRGDQHFRGQRYQYEVVELALKHVKDRRVAVDIGAHVGYLAKEMPFERVIAFEPDPDNFECLVENVPNVFHIPLALGNKAGMVTLYRPRRSNSGTGFVSEDVLGYESIQVPQVTLDSFLLQNVDYIKIDVQGSELQVLHGGLQTIHRCSPVISLERTVLPHPSRQQTRTEAVEFLMSRGMFVVDEFKHDVVMRFR
jgi:FkbM family methyltransferase